MADLILPRKDIDVQLSKQDLLYSPKVRSHFTLSSALMSAKKIAPETRIGLTNGAFCVPHVGHFVFLGLCRAECSILIVAINSDVSLAKLGRTSPFSEEERAFMLASLQCVDYVVLFDDETPFNIISILKPDEVYKGGEYSGKEVISAGVNVKIIKHPFTEIHSSEIIKKYDGA